jgi:hypothetical protein
MLGDDGCHLGQLDPLGHADDLGRQIRRQSAAAAGTLTRAVGHDLVGVGAERAAIPLVTGLGAARLGLVALLLAVGGGRLGGGARGLLRALQAQHQLDQLLLAQTLKIAAAHLTRESAKSAPGKRLGEHPSGAPLVGHAALVRTPWVITIERQASEKRQ